MSWVISGYIILMIASCVYGNSVKAIGKTIGMILQINQANVETSASKNEKSAIILDGLCVWLFELYRLFHLSLGWSATRWDTFMLALCFFPYESLIGKSRRHLYEKARAALGSCTVRP